MRHDMSHNDFHVVICEFFWLVCQKHPSVAPVLTAQHRASASWLAFARKRQKYFRASLIFFFYIWLNEAE